MLSFKYIHHHITLGDIEDIKIKYHLRDMEADDKTMIYLVTTDKGCSKVANSRLNNNCTVCRFVIADDTLYTDIDLTIEHSDNLCGSFF